MGGGVEDEGLLARAAVRLEFAEVGPFDLALPAPSELDDVATDDGSDVGHDVAALMSRTAGRFIEPRWDGEKEGRSNI